ncbi:MAG: peroxiredoxin-like family protein [Cyanobacteria bacterium J06641_5]
MRSQESFAAVLRQRVSDGCVASVLEGCEAARQILVLVWPHLGDFDPLEYAWWLQRERDRLFGEGIMVRAVAIGDRAAGQKFCEFTGFPAEWLFVDPEAELHHQLGLYKGLSWQLPGFDAAQNAWLNLVLMCAGLGSPGTLREVLRGYTGDRTAPQLIGDGEVVRAKPLPALTGENFQLAGGKGFQRPFELATLRLRNMGEVLGNWRTYVPDARYLTQRGGTFLFDANGELIYEHRDRGILGFSATMASPLAFLAEITGGERP